MRSLAFLTLAAAVAFAAGCKKKPKETAPDSAPPPTPVGSAGQGGSGTNVGVVPAGGVGVVTNPGAIAGGGGGGGGVMSALKAGRRAQALNELKNLGEIIETMRDPFGKMPTRDAILAEVKRTAPAIYKGIEEGAYVLTGTTDGGGLWAYEVGADKTPGIAVIGGRATRSTPDELAPYFRQSP